MIYTFGVPGYAVWSFHVLFGLFLIYIAYVMHNKKNYNKYLPLGLVIIGSLAIVYHSHLVQYHKFGGFAKEQERIRLTK